MPRLITICGATATGKSGVALALAGRLQSSILSADSRQVYREFDIGTAKPTAVDRTCVPHHLIDICDPTETMTLADYQQQAQNLIAAVDFPVSPPLLLVGGTGLYIKSVVRGLKIPRVAPMPELRSQLAELGQSQCYAMLQQVDRSAAEKIHLNDPVRTLRALEVFYVDLVALFPNCRAKILPIILSYKLGWIARSMFWSIGSNSAPNKC